MIISLTIVVSFHQNLLTKLDRAFRIQCAYMEGSKTIDADLNVRLVFFLFCFRKFSIY